MSADFMSLLGFNTNKNEVDKTQNKKTNNNILNDSQGLLSEPNINGSIFNTIEDDDDSFLDFPNDNQDDEIGIDETYGLLFGQDE